MYSLQGAYPREDKEKEKEKEKIMQEIKGGPQGLHEEYIGEITCNVFLNHLKERKKKHTKDGITSWNIEL